MPDLNPFRLLPKRNLKEVKRNRYLTEEEYERVQKSVFEEWHSVAIEVLVYTGMRHNQAIQFRKSWINWDAGTFGEISLPRDVVKGKREPRIIPLFPTLRHTLEDWCARSPGDYVFCHWSRVEGDYVPYRSFSSMWRRVRARAGVKDVRIHDLRHTFASWWAQRGGSLLTLKEMLGHADMRMVERYAHLDTAAKHSAMEVVVGKY